MSISERTERLIGQDGMEKLSRAKVLVFGVGGVGGFTCEALVRAGIGTLDIVDGDVVSESNINRQIIATHQTLGMDKVEVMKRRIQSINPACQVHGYKVFYLPGEESAEIFDFAAYDYVVDAIDTVSAKIHLIIQCKRAGTAVISSMGTGNKLNPELFKITDISKTKVCPLAKVVRKELRDREIEDVKVLFSTEEPIKTGGRTPGSISFVPSVAGLLIAGEVIRELLR